MADMLPHHKGILINDLEIHFLNRGLTLENRIDLKVIESLLLIHPKFPNHALYFTNMFLVCLVSV